MAGGASAGLMQAFGNAVTGLTAAGTTQGTALQLSSAVNRVTTVAANSGVLLPLAQPGDEVLVYNGGANVLTVYPPVGHTIGTQSANAGVAVPVGVEARFVKHAALTTWSTSSGVSGEGLTAAESAAGLTAADIDTRYAPGHVLRYGANTTPGTTDMTTAITRAINAMSQSGGGWITGGPATTYKITDEMDLKEGVKWDLNNSTVNFVVVGDKRGFTPKSHTALLNGTVNLTGSGLVGSAGDLHCPVVVGGYITNLGYHDVELKGLTLSTDRTGGMALGVFGDSYNITIDRIELPSSSTLGNGIVLHWSGDGSNPPALTKHAYNTRVSNIRAGEMTYNNATAAVVYISAQSTCLVENVYAERARNSVIFITAGDYGGEYAGAAIKALVHRNIYVRNVTCKQANTYCAYVEGWEDNYAGTPIISHPIILENIRSVGDGTASVGSGIRAVKIRNLIVRNPDISGHQHGVEFEEGAENCRVEDGRCYSNREHGVYIGHGVDPPNDCTAERVECYGNGTGGATASGVHVEKSNRTRVAYCIAGTDGTESVQDYGFRVTDTAVDAILECNYVRSSAGYGYALAGATDYGILVIFRDNRCAAGVTSKIGGLNILPIGLDFGTDGSARRRFRATRAALTADITPTAGTWIAGDVIWYENPTAGGYAGTLCVTGGTPGTWKRFGTTEA